MDIAITPLILALFTFGGTIIGALIGSVIPNFLQNRNAYRSFLRNQLIELYEDINRWLLALISLDILSFRLVFKGVKDWDWYLDQTINSDNNKELKFYKSEIIINLHFSKLITIYNDTVNSVQDLHKFINTEIAKSYEAGIDINIHKITFESKVNNLIDKTNILKSNILNLAKKI